MQEYKFKKLANIGTSAAEDDNIYLTDCFCDNGYLEILQNIEDRRYILVGRTGVGKTALMQKLKENYDHCIFIDANLSGFCYSERTTILDEMAKNGINLAPNLKYLWMHIFMVRVIQEIVPSNKKNTLIEWIKDKFAAPNATKAAALDYIEKHKSEFWMETSQITKKVSEDFTNEFEKSISTDMDVRGQIGIVSSSAQLSGSISSSKSVSSSSQYEIQKKGFESVGRDLAEKISTIPEVINCLMEEDRYKKILYILIDRLDESIVTDRFRFQSIRGLVDAAHEVNKCVPNLKIIVSIRSDMIGNIFEKIKIPGYQSEKIRDLFLPIYWTPEELIDLANKRIAKLIKKTYEPKANVTFLEVFPEEVNIGNAFKEKTEEYILSRTWRRPRDIIDFINQCLVEAEGETEITQEIIFSAEVAYSKTRMKSIQQEWEQTYPAIHYITDSLSKLSLSFKANDFTDEILLGITEKILADTSLPECEEKEVFEDYRMNVYTEETRNFCLKVMYDIGVIGIKFKSNETIQWSHIDYKSDYTVNDIRDDSPVNVHKALWPYYGFSNRIK
jgi:hypothetical protein